ncbi:MAG: hypothetical protein WD904_01340 [Dehalococcoidia bacterium]
MRFSRHWTILFLAVAIAALSLSRPTSGAAGDLDQGFGTGGVAIAEIGGPGSRALALDLQDDGKIVVTGQDQQGNLIVIRFNSGGSLDTSFAEDGLYTSDLIRRGEDIEVVSAGKMLATGFGDDHLVRLNNDGTPDESFGGDGVTGSQFFNPDDPSETEEPEMSRLIAWPGDNVIVGGTIDYGPYFFTFARYNSNGVLDNSFGENGQVQTDFSPPDDGLDQVSLALAAYPGDRFVAAGYRDVADDTPESSVVAMYNADGTLDDSFGDDGKTTTSFFSSRDWIEEIFALPDGRVLAVGDGLVDPGNFGQFQDTLFMARYNANGTLDETFGNSNGFIIIDKPGSQEVQGAVLADDGKIIVVGVHEETGSQAFIARFDSEGNPDAAFGQSGWVFLDAPAVPGAQFNDVTLTANGAILIAGSVQAADGQRAAVFKLMSTAGTSRTWGDNNCSGAPDPIDSLLELRFDGGLSTNTGDCPDMGQVVDVSSASPHPWGDVDCSGAANPVDSLKLLRFDAGLNVEQPVGCPEIGEGVLVSEPG